MNVCELGSDDWWTVVQSTPDFEEALEMLTNYKGLLVEKTIGKSSYVHEAAKLTRVNAAIKRINRLIAEADTSRALREFLGSDQYEEFVEFKRLKECNLMEAA